MCILFFLDIKKRKTELFGSARYLEHYLFCNFYSNFPIVPYRTLKTDIPQIIHQASRTVATFRCVKFAVFYLNFFKIMCDETNNTPKLQNILEIFNIRR